jgi:hypothetical protein
MKTAQLATKTPWENKPFLMDFTNYLEAPISTIDSVTLANEGDVTKSDTPKDTPTKDAAGYVVSQWLQGGTIGDNPILHFRVTDTAGRKKELCGELQVVDCEA